MKKILAIALMMVAGGAFAAAPPDTQTAGSAAYILTPLHLTDSDSLDFGSWATNSDDCDIRVTPALIGDGTVAELVASDCVQDLTTPVVPNDDSDWTVTGEAGETVSATLMAVTDPFKAACDLDADTVNDDFTLETSNYTSVGVFAGTWAGVGSSLTSGPIAAGANAFAIGADAHLASNQCPGLYGGNFTIRVTYF